MNFLNQRGMICNKDKTELITFIENPPLNIVLEGNTIEPKDCIKALGITLDNKLTWAKHIEGLTTRITRVINGLKIIRKKFTRNQFKNIVTSQVYGVLYYGSVVWLNPSLSKTNMKNIERMHYSACRMIVGDWRSKWHRTDLNTVTGRMTPKQWMLYAGSSQILKCERSREPTNLWMAIEKNLYHNRRHTNPRIVDKSLRKIGRKSLCNWGGVATDRINFDWFAKSLSNDTIRINLKKTFQP